MGGGGGADAAAGAHDDKYATPLTAPSADLSRTRGDFGSVTSLRTTWGFEVDDLTKVPATYLLGCAVCLGPGG